MENVVWSLTVDSCAHGRVLVANQPMESNVPRLTDVVSSGTIYKGGVMDVPEIWWKHRSHSHRSDQLIQQFLQI